jgi:hypothetical protein
MKLGILDSGRSAALCRSDLVGFLSRPRWAFVPSPADRQTGGSRAYNSSGSHSPEDQFVEEATPSGAGRVDLSCGDPLPGAVSGICCGFSHNIALIRQSSHERKPAVYGDGHGRKRHVCNLDDPGGGGGGDHLRLRTVFGSGSRGRLSRHRHQQRGSNAERYRGRSLGRIRPDRPVKPRSMHGHASHKWHSALYGRRNTQRRFFQYPS